MKILSNLLMTGLLLFALLPASATGQVAARLAEVGPNDFRITPGGDEGRTSFNALDPAVAYNSDLGQFMIVWSGDDEVDGAFEIYGQRLAATGERLGKAFRISDMGATDAPRFDALAPAVVYNAKTAEYLVVWSGNDLGRDFAVYGQRLAATGEARGSNDFLIARAPALRPALAFNPDQQEYLVVWQGEESARAAEIYGQRLSATGSALGTTGFRISDMGETNEQDAFDAFRPAVTYNGRAGEYLVVWEGDDDGGANVDNAFEIFGQRLKAVTGEEVGVNDFAISDMGGDVAATDFGAYRPAVAYNRTTDEYLVTWLGDDDSSGLLDNEYEIFAQRLQGDSGKALGVNDFRVSEMGDARDARFAAAYPAVAAAEDGFLVVWRGDHNAGALVDGEHEIFARRLTGDADAAAGFRLSDMGEDGDTRFAAAHPAVAAAAGQFLVIWSGTDDDVEFSTGAGIFGQQVRAQAAGPAVLAAFAAAVDSVQAVHLKWNVVGDPDGTSFEVEHRTTGAFEVIARVDGGNAEAFSYPIEGLSPGRHLFRLKQVGPDGTPIYSPEVEALIEVPGDFFSTSAYPNPFNDATIFTLTVKETQHVELAVYDMLGRRVAELHNGLVEANQIRTFRFEASNFSSGTYFLRAVGSTFHTTQQVLLVR